MPNMEPTSDVIGKRKFLLVCGIGGSILRHPLAAVTNFSRAEDDDDGHLSQLDRIGTEMYVSRP